MKLAEKAQESKVKAKQKQPVFGYKIDKMIKQKFL